LAWTSLRLCENGENRGPARLGRRLVTSWIQECACFYGVGPTDPLPPPSKTDTNGKIFADCRIWPDFGRADEKIHRQPGEQRQISAHFTSMMQEIIATLELYSL